ncbi:MAG: hypothetical protein E7299_09840 [Lachnospiraceae bacterium]|nr:hypothetical protein [Lachnospiraceae bacterium]
MIAFCKKWGRYGLVCPIVFMSKEIRERVYECLTVYWKYLAINQRWVWMVTIFMLVMLLYYRSAELYTYSIEEELQYLGRLPVVWERQKKLYIPYRLLQKSSTGRYTLKTNYPLKRKQQMTVYARNVRLTLDVKKIMHFQILSEGGGAII